LLKEGKHVSIAGFSSEEEVPKKRTGSIGSLKFHFVIIIKANQPFITECNALIEHER
jgi:hypothetical protein